MQFDLDIEISSGINRSLPRWQKLEFIDGHPNRTTHCHQERPRKVWPIYRAKRLPDLWNLETDQDENNDRSEEQERTIKRELYAQGALIMFLPFRNLSDLVKDNHSNWWTAYLHHKPQLAKDAKSMTILGNMQNFYESFCRSGINSGEPEFPNDVNLLHGRQEQHPENDEDPSALDLLEAEQGLQSAETTDNARSIEDPLVAKLTTLHDSLFQLTPPNQTATRVTVQQANIAVSQLPQKKKHGSFSLPGRASLPVNATDTQRDDPANNPNGAILDHVIGTRVDLLWKIEKALLEKNYTVCPSVSSSAPVQLEANFPTMHEHSQHWTLNEKQHWAFVLIAACLLKHISEANRPDKGNLATQMSRMSTRIDDLLRNILPSTGQLNLFLSGSGGTGKSRVIQTFVDFARRWHSIASHVICASSGVAAILIGGCTLHTALGIGISMNPSEPNNNHIVAWSEVGIVILDEFSMIKSALYSLTNNRLQKIKGRNDKPFGGVHMILSGDFYQLPPVGSFIFQTPTQHDNQKDDNAMESMRGRHLWKTELTDVIELTENHRQSTDRPWAESLERWRINQPNDDDIAAVNSRFVDVLVERPPPQTIIAVTQNDHREAGMRYYETRINDAAHVILSESDHDWRKRGILLVQARLSQTEGHQKVRPQQQNYIREMNEKRLGFPGNLVCILGAPYMVTINTDVSKKIANGTMCHLYDIILRNDAAIRIHRTKNGAQMPTVYADEIVCILFHHRLAEFKATHNFDSLPLGCFPVITTKKTIRCKLGKNNKTFSVSVTQFPCTLANIITGHKIQAQSLNSVILGTLSKIHQYGTTGWIYVVLSRVRTLSGLFLLVKLCTDVKKYKPRISVMKEMTRLRKIESQTLSRLQKAFQ